MQKNYNMTYPTYSLSSQNIPVFNQGKNVSIDLPKKNQTTREKSIPAFLLQQKGATINTTVRNAQNCHGGGNQSFTVSHTSNKHMPYNNNINNFP
jgi:hypothetical protein